MKLNELTDNQRAKFQWLSGAQESFDGRERCLNNALKEYVKSMNGFIYIPNVDHIQTVLVCDEDGMDWRQDVWREAYIYALKLTEDDELVMFTDLVMGTHVTEWTVEDIEAEDIDDSTHWYGLDWDCSNAYLHNIQRIVYYLLYEEMEDKQ